MRSIFLKSYSIPAFILVFIFCGAIVGETVSLSMVVSTLGSAVISKLYLVNGLLLLGLPLLLFYYIDKSDRGTILSKQLLFTAGLLTVILILILVSSTLKSAWANIPLIMLYPVAYLSKSMLFLTFWTFASDIFSTSESKKVFPLIAAWGFAGGLAGACIARFLVAIISTEMVMTLWIMSYLVAWIFARRLKDGFEQKLLSREEGPETSTGILGIAGSILALKLVRLIAVFYFFIFIAIFCLDFLFWYKCYQWFKTSETIASFQYTFYFIHAVGTIAGLRFVLPRMISRVGFSRIFYTLPVVLLVGSFLLLLLHLIYPDHKFFIIFVIVLFCRHIAFENAFSPIYQMFFTAIEKDKRGKAKMFLEGMIKPGAIITSGLILMLIKTDLVLILIFIFICAVILLITVFYIRRTYTLALIPDTGTVIEPQKLLEELGHQTDERLMCLIREFTLSDDVDMRIVSVKLLAELATPQSLEYLVNIYNHDERAPVRELIARSLGDHFGYNTKPFIERLMHEANPRIRANAIYSLNMMRCHWKLHLKPILKQLLFDSSIRVKIEAAHFVWENSDYDEKVDVKEFLESLLTSTHTNRRAAGLYLIGLLKVPGWELVLLENISSTAFQVFSKGIDVILKYASSKIRIKALQVVDTLGRGHIAVTGKVIENVGSVLWDDLIEVLPKIKSRRMVFEIVKCLRVIADSIRLSGKRWFISAETANSIKAWIESELDIVYQDSYIWSHLKKGNGFNNDAGEMLDNALRENLTRLCEWAVNAMVLLDKKGVLIWGYNDIDIREQAQRFDLIEIIEGTSYQKIGALILPLLKTESWDVIARIGKGYFHLNDILVEDGLLHFLRSDNRWLCLCSLYSLGSFTQNVITAEIMEVLKLLSKDPNSQIAQIGKEFLDNPTSGEFKRSKAFDFLDRVLFFKKTALFKYVSAEKLMSLAEITQHVVYEKEAVISTQGELSEHLYIVKTGCIRVVRSDGVINTEILKVTSGETYGEIGLFTHAPRSASAIADEHCELYMIKRPALKKLLLEIPDIATSLLEVLSERLRKSGEEVVELKKYFKENRQIENSFNAGEDFTL